MAPCRAIRLVQLSPNFESVSRDGPEGRARSVPSVGQKDIDRRLPGRGLGLGWVHEVAGGGRAVDGQDCCAHQGKVLWAVTRPDLFAPAIAQAGLAPDRVIHVAADVEKALLACFEEGLRHDGLGAVVAETARFSIAASRRLQ